MPPRAATLGDLAQEPTADDAVDESKLQFKEAKRRWVDRFERPYLEQLLSEHKGNATAAARTCGLDRVHLLKLLRKHQLR